MSTPDLPASPLPPRYAAWMGELLQGEIPGEPRATCDNCAMCAGGSARHDDDGFERQSDPRFYDPEVKCCSFLPVLWNFLAGDLLADETAEAAAGRATVEARLAAGVAVTPLGLERAPVYDALYRHIPQAFGRTRAMLCPHYLSATGRCGVWRHRESTCATFFCKHERGAVGKAFWDRLHQLLRVAEESLARWCVLELDLGPAAMAALFPNSGTPSDSLPKTAEDFDNLPDLNRQRRLWGTWAGREREFYRAAADRVRPLTWQQVAAIGGSRLAVHALLARSAYQELMSRSLPGRLRSRPARMLPIDSQNYQVTSYSALDPLRISRRLAQVLHYFDGRPTSEALEAIAQEHQMQLSPRLVGKLVDYGILAPAEGGEEAEPAD